MTPTVGKAYRGRDGIVRWVTARSRRGYYRLLWLNEEDGVWFSGGIITAERWVRGGLAERGEAEAPQPGQSYRLADAMGRILDRVMAE